MFDVIIPIYKTKLEYIKECLESILIQDFDNWECYIVDGTPKDWISFEDNYNYIDSLVQSDDRFHYFTEDEPKTASHARNQAVKEGSNPYVVLLDSDDYLCENYFTTMCSQLDDDYDIFYCRLEGVNEVDRNTVLQRMTVENNRYNFAPFIPPQLKGLIHSYYPIYPTATIIKRDIFEKIGGFNEEWTIIEDGEFFVRLLGYYNVDDYFRDAKFVNIIGGHHRIHEGQAMNQGGEQYSGSNYLDDYKKFKNKFDEKYPMPTITDCPDFVSEDLWQWLLDLIERKQILFIKENILIQKESEWSHLLENPDDVLEVPKTLWQNRLDS